MDYTECVQEVTTVTRVTALYSHGEQESISECTVCQILRWMRLQRQKTTLGSAAARHEQESEVTVDAGCAVDLLFYHDRRSSFSATARMTKMFLIKWAASI